MLVDPMQIAQGQGFIRRYLELDVESGKPGAEQALEWFTIVENGISAYRKELQEKISLLVQIKQTLG